MTEKKSLPIKLVLIGDSGTGKSNILLRYCNNTFTPSFITTVGIELRTRNITFNNKFYRVCIWDTAGQERFRAISTAYYKGVNGFIIIFDKTDVTSFKNVFEYWLEIVKKNGTANVKTIIIGNKIDMLHRIHVSTEQAIKLCEEKKISYYEVSARTGDNVSTTIDTFIKQIILDMEVIGNDSVPLKGILNIGSKCDSDIGSVNGDNINDKNKESINFDENDDDNEDNNKNRCC